MCGGVGEKSMCGGWGLTVLRVVVGFVFAMHGYQKLTQYGVDGTSQFLASLGLPIPSFMAILLITAELIGGIMLILGIMVRKVAAIEAVVALVALYTVHINKGFFINPTNGMAGYGYEYILTLFASMMALYSMGGGRLSLGKVIARKCGCGKCTICMSKEVGKDHVCADEKCKDGTCAK